jgi:predicted permease
MTSQINIIFNQIVLFAIMMCIGFAGGKTRVITKDGLQTLADLLVKIILPALIFSMVAGNGVTIEEFTIAGPFAIGVAIVYAALTLTGFLTARLLKLKGKEKSVFVMLNVFGNFGFMGLPLILGIFTEPIARVCMTVYAMFDSIILWTFGVYLCSRHDSNFNRASAIKNMLNPTTLALAAAFIIMAFKIPLPEIVFTSISGLGGTSPYFSMIFIGASLAFVPAKSLVQKPSLFVLPAVKMIAMPVLIYILTGLFLPHIPRTVLTLLVALPCMNTVAVLAKTYGSAHEYATQGIFITTILSLFTIPLVSAIISFL